MTDEERKWVKDVLKNFPVFAERYFKIKTKDGKIVPFKFNSAQRKVHQIVEETIAAGKPLHFIILKARQEGISTYFAGMSFWRNMTRKYWKTAIIGHVKDASNNLFDMIKRFYNYLEPALKPELQASNEKKLAFSLLESEMKVFTAEGGDSVGRSDNFQDLVLTEVAFWRDAKAVLTAVFNAVGTIKDSLEVIESTANGVGGEFYERWQSAKNGESDFIPIFLAWFELDEYRREFLNQEEKDRFENSLTDQEKDRMKTYNVSLEQLNWYRYKLANDHGGDKLMMQQENPYNDIESFVASGRPVFDTQLCLQNYELAKREKFRRGDLVWKGKEVEFVEGDRGFVRLYKEIKINPLEMYRYVAGCDVAEGLEQGDYSVIPVMDRKTNEVVLEWHGHIDPDLLADEQEKISKFLGGDIYFNTERNNHGLTTIVGAYKKRLKQYYNQTFEKGYPSDSSTIGFKTSSQSKAVVINDLNEWIRESIFSSNSVGFWDECLTFVKNAKGQMQAQGKDEDVSTKCYDDRVIAYALMIRCSLWMPNYFIQTPKEIVSRPYLEEMDYVIDEATF
jgi:hypothetical protein